MAAAGIQPFFHVEDSNGSPYVGAKLYVYDAGTTTLKSIYSNAGLTVALANPLTSDASGNFARFYLATGTYKVRAEQSSGTLIWEHDNVDTSLPAGTGALPVASGGTGSTTAAAARTALDVPSNSELTAISSTIATINASIQSIVAAPQGRLTLTTGVPVLAAGVAAGTAVYYTPYIGNLVPIYDGTQYNVTTFAELTLTLHSNHVASAIYDVFVFKNGATVTIGTGPAWNTATAGSGARGAGAGTTELTRIGGVLVNANSITARNGATTYTVDAYKGTFVGSIFIDGTNGQITCNKVYGQTPKFGVSNAYNRSIVFLQQGDTTASWNNSTASWVQSNGSASNYAYTFCCLAEEHIEVDFRQTGKTGGTGPQGLIGIGVNSVAAPSGFSSGTAGLAINFAGQSMVNLSARHIIPPALGVQKVNPMEYGAAAGSWVFYGGNDDMLMTVSWMA